MLSVSYACTGCGKVHAFEAPESLNVPQDPSLRDRIKDGSLFVRECPSCGSRNLVVWKTLYHDPDAKLLVWLLPGGGELPAGAEAIASQIDGYTLRTVPDAGSLIEKVNIFDAGLDDTVMELCKGVTRREMAEKMGPAALSLPMKYFRTEGPDHDILLSLPMDGAMHTVTIGFNVYEDCSAILRRNPGLIPSGGFLRIDSAWVESILG